MKAIVSVVAVLGVVMAGIALSGTPEAARAATVVFTVQAAGANEVPAVSSGGAANAQFTFDDETNELIYVVAVRGITADQVTAAHIHRGAAGEAGPVVHTLSEEGFLQIAGSLALTDEDVDALMAGELYLNVHSVDFPDGFARGQLVPPEAATSDGAASDGADATDESAAPEAGEAEEVAGTSDIAPPNTGDAGLADGGGTSLLPAGVLMAVLAIASSALLIRSRA